MRYCVSRSGPGRSPVAGKTVFITARVHVQVAKDRRFLQSGRPALSVTTCDPTGRQRHSPCCCSRRGRKISESKDVGPLVWQLPPGVCPRRARPHRPASEEPVLMRILLPRPSGDVRVDDSNVVRCQAVRLRFVARSRRGALRAAVQAAQALRCASSGKAPASAFRPRRVNRRQPKEQARRRGRRSPRWYAEAALRYTTVRLPLTRLTMNNTTAMTSST